MHTTRTTLLLRDVVTLVVLVVLVMVGVCEVFFSLSQVPIVRPSAKVVPVCKMKQMRCNKNNKSNRLDCQAYLRWFAPCDDDLIMLEDVSISELYGFLPPPT